MFGIVIFVVRVSVVMFYFYILLICGVGFFGRVVIGVENLCDCDWILVVIVNEFFLVGIELVIVVEVCCGWVRGLY